MDEGPERTASYCLKTSQRLHSSQRDNKSEALPLIQALNFALDRGVWAGQGHASRSEQREGRQWWWTPSTSTPSEHHQTPAGQLAGVQVRVPLQDTGGAAQEDGSAAATGGGRVVPEDVWSEQGGHGGPPDRHAVQVSQSQNRPGGFCLVPKVWGCCTFSAPWWLIISATEDE